MASTERSATVGIDAAPTGASRGAERDSGEREIKASWEEEEGAGTVRLWGAEVDSGSEAESVVDGVEEEEDGGGAEL